MTRRGVIEEESPQQCDMCGTVAELRPYGPRGSCVCFKCGMLDEKEAERQFYKQQGWEELIDD